MVIIKVIWISFELFGVGIICIVEMCGGIVGDEEFILWEFFICMVFWFNECFIRVVGVFVEDYWV